jgi:pimeloyl-ACP methyl ester carboxylesterase
MAAADPKYSKYVEFVWAVGAHHDMSRVGRFFATNESPRPDGTTLKMQSHEYGALVLIYTHLEDFFSKEDIPFAHDAIRLLLREEWNASHDAAAKLSPAGQEVMRKLYDKDRASLREPLLASVAKHEAEFNAVSPRTVLKDIRVPVLLVHGAGDDVIPPSETLWLARDIPAQYLHHALVTTAISHVGTGDKPEILEKIRLLHVMAHLLREVEAH